MRPKWLVFLGILSLVFWGCAPHKPLEIKPSEPLPASFSLKGTGTESLQGPWWFTFEDQTLNQLIEEALRHNLDLKIGVARILEARALLKQATAALYPQVNAQASWEKSKEPGFFGDNRGESYRLSLSASYELDLWKRLRAKARAARYQLEAQEEEFQTFLVGLSAEVAEAYFLVATLEAQKDVLDELLQNTQQELSLTKEDYLQGLTTAQQVLEAENQIFALEAQKNDLERALGQAKHALEVLLGRWPGQAPKIPKELPTLRKVFPVGLPSVVLNHRPDVKAAYWRVKAADAQVAALVAEHFPRLDLLATLGRSHTAFSIGDIVGSFWSVGLQASLSIFEGGAVNARIRAQKAAALQALYAYQKTLLKAFQEVEDALTANLAEQKRLRDLAQQEKRLKHILTLEEERYRLGVSSYLPVLKAREALLQLRRQRLEVQHQLISARISLYRALAGPWTQKYLAQALRGAHES